MTTVRSLTPKDFDGVGLRNKSCCAVVFFHPSCSHCIEFLPIFRRVATRCGFLDFFSFDSDAHREGLARLGTDARGYKVTGFPTTIFFSGGKPFESVVGKRSEGDFLTACMRAAESMVCPRLRGTESKAKAASKKKTSKKSKAK